MRTRAVSLSYAAPRPLKPTKVTTPTATFSSLLKAADPEDPPGASKDVSLPNPGGLEETGAIHLWYQSKSSEVREPGADRGPRRGTLRLLT